MLASYIDSIAHKCDIEIDASFIQPTQDAISTTTHNSSNPQPSNTDIPSQLVSPGDIHVSTTSSGITSSENGNGKEMVKEKESRTAFSHSMHSETTSLISSSSPSSFSRKDNVVDIPKL